ncbi:MAG TPA: HAMP domain-containing sensor histidine kinase [Burkholderiales bacterium]|nr:HAMP domain-containing sensor histidine kinase [Burkholderiales bacterium]
MPIRAAHDGGSLTEAAATGPARIVLSHPQVWLGLMLMSLQAALAWGIDDWWPRAFLLAHFGMFLLWQPVWRGEQNVESRYAFLVVIAGFVFAVWNTWWLMAVWLAVLFGLIGGSVPGIIDRRQRLVSMLAALYLLTMLLIWVVPHTFAGQTFETALVVLVQYGLPLLPLAIILIHVDFNRSMGPIAVDLFYSVILFLLVTALVLGAFVVKQVSHGNYALALAQTLFVIAVLLLLLSWLWNPRSSFVGIGHLLSRYLLSLGLPFEQWVQRVAGFAEQESQPQRFLELALKHVLELPWVVGVEWEARLGHGEFGKHSEFAADLSFQDLRLRIYTRWALSPAVLMHLKLLTQMVGHFYDAKRREQAQRQHAYTQAIYETGARLTHDVKNLLQSLRSLCAAVDTSDPDQAQALQALMQRQLPQITQRLNVTLDKLKAPQLADTSLVDAALWWEGLRQRHGNRNVQFELEGALEERKIPVELFDSVTDNLIENALNKAASSPAVRVRVTFSTSHGGTLTVCDTGEAVAKGIATELFDAPVASRTGLGVGLYHAAQQAEQLGYRLALAANEPGMVCFVLTQLERSVNPSA